MGTHTVRLDDDAERTLMALRKATEPSISAVLKRGLQAYGLCVLAGEEVHPIEIYRRLDLGAGGLSRGPANNANQAVREAILRAHGRNRMALT